MTIPNNNLYLINVVNLTDGQQKQLDTDVLFWDDKNLRSFRECGDQKRLLEAAASYARQLKNGKEIVPNIVPLTTISLVCNVPSNTVVVKKTNGTDPIFHTILAFLRGFLGTKTLKNRISKGLTTDTRLVLAQKYPWISQL